MVKCKVEAYNTEAYKMILSSTGQETTKTDKSFSFPPHFSSFFVCFVVVVVVEVAFTCKVEKHLPVRPDPVAWD